MKQQNDNGFSQSGISRQIALTWLQTILGLLLMAGLSCGVIWWLGIHWSISAVVLVGWALLPLYGWYKSADMVKKLMRCEEPDPLNPQHMRLLSILEKLYPKTGLSQRPPVFISPLPVPNAFATGRSPSNAFIAATEGLLYMDMTDDELEAILAHELAHVASRDVAISSLLAVLGSLFTIVLAMGVPAIFNAAFSKPDRNANLLDKLDHKVSRGKKRFFASSSVAGSIVLFFLVFILANIFSRVVMMFVGRARESHADALASRWTGNPCALSSALQKLDYATAMMSFEIHTRLLIGGMNSAMFISDFDSETYDGKNWLARLRSWWQRIGRNHPPIPQRLAMLDRMSGGTCPRI